MSETTNHNYAVIVAGGSGTRLWPLSREELPKQIQKLISDKTLIEETFDRIAGIVPYENIFVSTTTNYKDKIQELLPNIPEANIVVEPVRRGVTAAFAYFTETIYRRDPEAVIFSLASDHAVTETEQFRATIKRAYEQVRVQPEAICLIGVIPDRPDTGMGYIKVDKRLNDDPALYSVEKFVEKPKLNVARGYVASGEYFWNAAYYCYRASTLIAAYDEADPKIMTATKKFIVTQEMSDFEKVPEKPHEIEIVNAVKFPLLLIPASFTWSDIGNWEALHDLLAQANGDDKMLVSSTTQHIDIDSTNSLVLSNDDKKLIATVGLSNIIIVDTEDALLIMDKGHNQDIKAALQMMKDRGLDKYL